MGRAKDFRTSNEFKVPRSITEEDIPVIIEKYKAGVTKKQICKELNILRYDLEPVLLENGLIDKSQCKYSTVAENAVREFRLHTGMTQLEFADYFGVPVRTLQDWEQSRRTPPDYILSMMVRIWKLETK